MTGDTNVSPDFKVWVFQRESEFIAKGGMVNVEFSMNENMDKFLYLQDRAFHLPSGKRVHWDCFNCDTCRKHDPECPVHCELVFD